MTESLSYRNQSIDLQNKSQDWFLYDRDLRHERFKHRALSSIMLIKNGTTIKCLSISRSSHRRCSVDKGVLKNFAIFTGKHLSWSLFLIKFRAFRPATLLKETPTQVFSCKICETFKNTYFEKHLRTTALHFL